MKDNTVNGIGEPLRKPYTAPCIETLRMDLSGFICESGWDDSDGDDTIGSGDGDGSTQPSGPWVDKDPDDHYAD